MLAAESLTFADLFAGLPLTGEERPHVNDEPKNKAPANGAGNGAQVSLTVSDGSRGMELPEELRRAVENGWPLFPVKPRDKEPLVKWRDKASSDPARIAAWAHQFPGCNWGLATGVPSGLLVVDADGEQGMESYAALGLPPTRRVKTGRGEHHYFRLPAGADATNAKGSLPEKIDVRGTGGYVIYPPSTHTSGQQYQFLGGELAEAPPELLVRLRKPKRTPPAARDLGDAPRPAARAEATERERLYAEKALADECAKFQALPSGNGLRNDTLNTAALSIASMVGVGWLDEGEAWVALWEAAADYRAQDGHAAVGKTMRSGWDAGLRQPRGPLPERGLGTPANTGEPWPEPEPLGGKLPPVHKLTPEMLPAAIRDMAEDIAARMQVPLDFSAVAAVATLAGVVGRRACIQPKECDPWRVWPNLWGGIVAEPGSMKSPVLSAVQEAVNAIEREWLEEHKAAMQAHSRAVEDAEDALKAWKRARDSKAGSRLPRPGDPPDAPPQRRLKTQDATLQSLHQILAANPAAIFVFRDELTGWFAQLDKAGREQERGFYLEGWNGDSPYTIDTIGRGSVYVPHVCLSLFGGIQPSRLRSHLAEALRGGPANDGLMQRFQLLVWPDPVKVHRVYVDAVSDGTAARRMEAIYRRVALMDAENPVVFRFAPEAQALFREWLPCLENRCLDPGESDAMRAHLAKYRKLMPALALLFALCDGSAGVVTSAHARMAAAWCDYLESHARRVYSAQAPTEQAAAIHLGYRLATGELGKPGEAFSLRDVYRHGWEGLGSPEQARAALAILEECGWVRKLPAPEGKAGRKSEVYATNPMLEPRHGDL